MSSNTSTTTTTSTTITTSTTATIISTFNTSGHVNASGYFIDDDQEELGYTDLKTVAVACIATLIPLGLALFAVFGLRMVWKSWREDTDERTLRRADSSDPNKSSHFLLPDEIKTSESQFSVIPAEELEEVMTTYNSASSGNTMNHNHTSKSTANGSIITMTMKNNHLIVETEERVPGLSESPGPPEPDTSVEETPTALVHQSAEAVVTEDVKPLVEQGAPNTGLSQSDLSVSSGASGHAGYVYGTQVEYVGEHCDILAGTVTSTRLKHVPFMVQPSQDIEDDELYLEQQHQLGNGLDDMPPNCNPYENPTFTATPEQQNVNPIS